MTNQNTELLEII